MLNTILDKLNISDDKLKQVIEDIFRQKFAYMNKMSYLRWLGTLKLPERVQSLTFGLIEEEYREKNPNTAGYYKPSSNEVRVADPDARLEHVLHHELNHFISENGKTLPSTFIDEGLTEMITLNMLHDNNISPQINAYVKNVNFTKLLYSILGDELIKFYIIGMTPEFKSKLSKLVCSSETDNLDDFFKILDTYHNLLNSDRRPKNIGQEELITRLTDCDSKKNRYSNNLIINSIIDEMADLKYFKDGNIDYNTLTSTIFDRLILLTGSSMEKTPYKELLEKTRYLVSVALNNSYLKDFWSQEEINELANKAVISLSYGRPDFSSEIAATLNSKVKDTSFYALKNKLDNYNYESNGSFDFSTFMMDFYSFVGTDKFQSDQLEVEKNLYYFLHKKLKGNINNELINELISKYEGLYSKLGKINVNNINTASESNIFEVYNDSVIKAYIEKKDNNFFIIINNTRNNSVDYKKVDLVKNGPKDYPFGVSYYDYNLKRSFGCRFNENFTEAIVGNKIVKSSKGLSSIVDDVITDEMMISNFKDYVYYFNDGEYLFDNSGVMYAGGTIDDVDKRSRFINYEDLLNDLRSRIGFLKPGTRDKVIEENIKRIISVSYGNMNIDNTIISRIIFNAKQYINGNNEALDNLDKINVDLVNQWKDYIPTVQATGLLYFKTEEERDKYFEKQRKRDIKIEASAFAKEHSGDFILEKNENYFDSSVATLGIENATLQKRNLNYYKTPQASKIDFKSLIEFLSFIAQKEDKNKKFIVNAYLGSLYNTLFGSTENMDINDLINELETYILDHIMNEEVIDYQYLDDLFEQIKDGYNNERDSIMRQMNNTQVVFNGVSQVNSQVIYNQIKMIKDMEGLPEEKKKEQIDLLVEIANKQNEANVYDRMIYEMQKVIAKEKQRIINEANLGRSL